MATLREQYETAKKNLAMAEDALAEAAVQVNDNPEYRQKQALDRDWHQTHEELKMLFAEAAPILLSPCSDFEKFRESWGSILPMKSPIWDKVQKLELRLGLIERQIKAVNPRKYKNLLDAQDKARKFKAECRATFTKLRDLVYRERQAHRTEAPGRHNVQLVYTAESSDGQGVESAKVIIPVFIAPERHRVGDSHRSPRKAAKAEADRRLRDELKGPPRSDDSRGHGGNSKKKGNKGNQRKQLTQG